LRLCRGRDGGRLLGLAATVALALPAAAAAGGATGPQAGVHVDPGSPAAKEYAIPLGQARANGGGSSGSGSGQLFGSGITRASASSAPNRGQQPTSASAGTARSTHRVARAGAQAHRRVPGRVAVHARAGRAGAPGGPAQASRVLGSGSGAGSGLIWMLAAAALVLALGGAGGAALARRGRRARPISQ
jgi:hypothetical protein